MQTNDWYWIELLVLAIIESIYFVETIAVVDCKQSNSNLLKKLPANYSISNPICIFI